MKLKPGYEGIQHTVRLVFRCAADVGRDATPLMKVRRSLQPIVKPAVLLLWLRPG